MATAWIESITEQVGIALDHRVRSPGRRRWPTATSSPGGTGPSRSARRRTWWADSSADTSRTRWPAADPGGQDLEQQRRLADAGLAPEQGHRSRDEPPRQHPVELLHPGRDGGRLGHVHRGQGHGHTRQVELVDGPHQRPEGRLLHQGVPLAAGGAPARPPGGRRAAVDAAVALGRLCHPPMVGNGCATPVRPQRRRPPGDRRRGPPPRLGRRGGRRARSGPDGVLGRDRGISGAADPWTRARSDLGDRR